MPNPEAVTTIYGLRCFRCGHRWIPRKPYNEVRICPQCKSAYWDTPKDRKATKIPSYGDKAVSTGEK